MKSKNLSSTFAATLLLMIAAQVSGVTYGRASERVSTQSAAVPTTTTSDDPRYAELRTGGFDALYNLDYPEARRRFRELQTQFPDHPAGWQFEAAVVWLETMNRSRRLQTSLYNDEAFYAETEEKPDPQSLREFRELTRAATARAEARLKRDAKDVEALYFLGATAGLKAAFAGAIERRFIAALREGDASVDRHRQVLKLDPTFTDAQVTIGLYDYVIGDLPFAVKAMATLGGFRGSKKRGLATLERVTREGRWANDDARTMLIALYRRERRPADAARVARELASRYKQNYLFKLELADALIAQAADARANATKANGVSTTQNRSKDSTTPDAAEREALSIFEEMLGEQPRRGVASTEARGGQAFDLVRYKYAEALAAGSGRDRAAAEFLRVANDAASEANLATWARLRAAQTLDLAGKRPDALTQYKLVLARPNVYDAHAQATRGTREPYRRTAPVQQGTAPQDTTEEKAGERR